jgi:hypothetical protein
MSLLPLWARKPKHKKVVVATQRGWEVESTGEVLRRVPKLAERLTAFLKEVEEVGEVSIIEELTIEPVVETKPLDVAIEEPTEEVKEEPKKRGRKPKPKDDSVKIDD